VEVGVLVRVPERRVLGRLGSPQRWSRRRLLVRSLVPLLHSLHPPEREAARRGPWLRAVLRDDFASTPATGAGTIPPAADRVCCFAGSGQRPDQSIGGGKTDVGVRVGVRVGVLLCVGLGETVEVGVLVRVLVGVLVGEAGTQPHC
jgi:hypothetical protein